MKTDKQKRRESGQAMIGLLLMTSLVVLTGVGLAVDYSSLWFHKEALQSAADAACQAGGMDMYAQSAGSTTVTPGFTPGVAGNCSTNASAALCQYASYNGYNGSGLVANTASNSVSFTFPSSVNGVTPPPTSLTQHPFMNVQIQENVPLHFLATVLGKKVTQVSAGSTCALASVRGIAPLIALNPNASNTFTLASGAELQLVGGGTRAVQVNSSNANAVGGSSGAILNTAKAGTSDAGADVGVVGGPGSPSSVFGSSGFVSGNGAWKNGVSPVPDPFVGVGVPSSVTNAPASTTSGLQVNYHVDGCPDSQFGCLEFSPGYYPTGINLGELNLDGHTAIFLPGVYRFGGGLISDDHILRNATPCSPTCSKLSTTTAPATSGVMFYFSSGSLQLTGFTFFPGWESAQYEDTVSSSALSCNGTAPDANLGLPSQLQGTVLWGMCTKNGTYVNGTDTTDSISSAGTRGLIFFNDRSNTTGPYITQTGGVYFAGSLYFHNTSYSVMAPFAPSFSDLPPTGITLLRIQHSHHSVGTGGAHANCSTYAPPATSSQVYILGTLAVDQMKIYSGTQLYVGLPAASNQYLAKVTLVQ